jgi:hypothetical protein
MINQVLQKNNSTQRVPNDTVYNIILTLILAFGIIWIIYSITPYAHYSLYLIEQKKNKLL